MLQSVTIIMDQKSKNMHKQINFASTWLGILDTMCVNVNMLYLHMVRPRSIFACMQIYSHMYSRPHTYVCKGARFANLLNLPCKSAKKSVAWRKWHSTFLCAEHFHFHEQHLFFCVNPLLLWHRVLNLGKVAIFFMFFGHFYVFDRKFDKLPYKM